jgi:hypothetical protein
VTTVGFFLGAQSIGQLADDARLLLFLRQQ